MEKDYLEIANRLLEYNYKECLGCIEIDYCADRIGYIIQNHKGEYVAIYSFDYLSSQYVSSDNLDNVKSMICKTVSEVIKINDNKRRYANRTN